MFHELATNSAKYGALSASGGYVTLDLCDNGETLQLLWREHGGPPLASEPEKINGGFGSRLVELTVSGQLGGSWQRHFNADGLGVELVIAKQAIAP